MQRRRIGLKLKGREVPDGTLNLVKTEIACATVYAGSFCSPPSSFLRSSCSIHRVFLTNARIAASRTAATSTTFREIGTEAFRSANSPSVRRGRVSASRHRASSLRSRIASRSRGLRGKCPSVLRTSSRRGNTRQKRHRCRHNLGYQIIA